MDTKTMVAAAGLALILSVAPALAQTCNPAVPATAPANRYTDNGDGTVTDIATTLMWKQCAEGLSGAGCATGAGMSINWQQALQQAQTVNSGGFAGYSDWRLPNVKELASLVEKQCSPAINLTLFPNTLGTGFWSSSPCAFASAYAWGVDFGHGDVGFELRNDLNSVRLVRGGQ